MSQDSTDNKTYPSTTILKDGFTIALSGPNVEYTKYLLEKIRDAKKQSPLNKPFILAIDGSDILGDYKSLIRTIQREFQPKKYTRFAGILIVKSFVKTKAITHSFNFIRNPYAKLPVSNKFVSLFFAKDDI